MQMSRNVFCLLAVFGLVTAFSFPMAATAQEDVKTAEMKLSSSDSDSDQDEIIVTGDCDLPLGGKLKVTNSTPDLVVVSICVGGDEIRLGPIKPGGCECYRLPNDPAFAGVSGEFKARSRNGSGSKPIQFN